ncbi:MAG: B12-binding domain-containing radical SAM protein [Planctomycetota bacterium]|jgi:radical SAM superfamily enzyme YgiQ (UPF0313 family)
MKIRLIQPSQLDDTGEPRFFKRVILPAGTMAYLAGLTPSCYSVAVTDDSIQEIDFDEEVDLVGLTGMTCQAPRAYQIADEFRKRGTRVIMGGIHASTHPQEALRHVDSVVIGEAEDIWEKLLQVYEKTKELDKIYRCNTYPDLQKLVLPRYDLLDMKKYIQATVYSKFPTLPISSTRGCPYNCDYCTVTRFWGPNIRTRPIDNVIAEIEAAGGKNFFFVDDNMIANYKYARELLKELIPLKIRWFTQLSTNILKHPDLLELAAEAGCHEVILGIESIDQRNLDGVNKSFNRPAEYKKLFSLLKQNRVSPHVMIIFGFEYDDKEVIRQTVDFMMDNDVFLMRLFVLTPLYGTVVYDKFLKEDRIIDRNWSHYDGNHVVFKLRNITAEELTTEMYKAYDKYYSFLNIGRRLVKFRSCYTNMGHRGSIIDDLLYQLMYHFNTREREDAWAGIRK